MKDLVKVEANLPIPVYKNPINLGNAKIVINQLGKNMHEHVYLLGKILMWVKQEIGHGNFEKWIKDNVWFTVKTAQRFISYTKKCDKSGFLIPEPHYLEKHKSDKLSHSPNLPRDYELPENYNLINADFREYLPKALPDNSIDLILTDPPYDEESLPLWDSLGEQAARLLRPGGALIAYSGQNFLDQVMEQVGKHLDFYWMIAVRHTHGQLRMWGKKVWNSWKPVIIWSKGKAEYDWFNDFISIGHEDTKEYYEFSQPVDQAKYLIEKFSGEENIVLDPMVGAGTTMLAARQCNRKCIGIEIEKDVFLKAKERFYESETIK